MVLWEINRRMRHLVHLVKMQMMLADNDVIYAVVKAAYVDGLVLG